MRTYVPDRSWAFYQQLPVRFVVHTESLRSGNQLVYAYKDVPNYATTSGVQRQVDSIAATSPTSGIRFSSLHFD